MQCLVKRLSGRSQFQVLAMTVLAGVISAVTAGAAWGGPETTAASNPAAPVAQTAPAEDLDAEQRELERQKREIEQKLADIAARRAARSPGSTTASTGSPQAGPATTPTTNPAAALETRPAEVPGPGAPAQPPVAVQQFTLHAQATAITQGHDEFAAPYQGRNSLPSHEPAKTSLTATLFSGARLWDGAAIYFDPELAGGEGFGSVAGIAGFPNGEIPRVGTPEPEPYVARLYIQQVLGLGGDREHIDSDVNQIAGYRDIDRLTLTVGKFGAVDFFDGNTYCHDPRSQFMNWALMDTGSWDYPADTRGYTYGVAMELNHADWAFRYAALGESTTANGGEISGEVLRAEGNVFELEERYKLHDHPGVVRLMAYENNAHMGNYAEAINHPGPHGPDVTLTRAWTVKYGFGISAEQSLSDNLGIFLRGGWDDGHTETWAFTEIDRTIALGLSLKGMSWGRPNDVLGTAVVVNGLSKDHRDYLAAGGYGFIIGDGRLHYALEEISETYYLIKVSDNVFLSPDFQFVDHPAYNSDRGPVFIFGLRAHIEF
jgi:high affinity Mn2+ porin